MKTWATIVAAAMSAVLYLNRPTDEPTPEPAVAATCCGDDCECCDCDIDSLIARMEVVEAKLKSIEQVVEDVLIATAEVKSNIKQEPLPAPVPVKVVAPTVQKSQTVQPSVQPSVNYQPRWQNYDGKSRMQHAADDHGIDTSKYSQAQVLQMMDSDHDRYGAGHSAIKASRSVASPVTYTYSQATYATPLRSYSTQTYSNCPGGVCPTQPRATVRQGIFRRWAR